MVSSILARRSSCLFNKLVSPSRSASVAPSVARSFNTNSETTNFEDVDRSVDVNRRSNQSVFLRGTHAPSFFSDFYNWNRILVRYCDGSSYTEDVEAVDPIYNLHYRGQRIFDALMEHFMEIGMKNASQAILTGCSAGGVGSILHCDQFRSMFPATTKVKCIADGAFFIHTKDIAGNYFMEANIFDGVVNLHGSAKNLPPSCTLMMKPSSCFLPVNSVPTVKTPIFIVNSYDTWQLSINLASNRADKLKLWTRCKFNVTECSREQLKILKGFMHEFVRQVQAGVDPDESKGMFINSCRTHCQTEFQPKWLGDAKSTLNGKLSVSDVVGEWFNDKSKYKMIDNRNKMPVECAMNPQEPHPINKFTWLPWAS